MLKNNPYLQLIIFSLFLFLPGIANLPVVDRDEAHFAQASRQMIQTGQYFQIRFQDVTRFQKPPGINWLQAASVHLFSDGNATEIWPYRVPSLLGALLSVILTFFFARRFVSQQIALFAAGFLASTLLLNVEAHMAVIDTSLLFSVLLMQGALWIIYSGGIGVHRSVLKTHWGWALVFWLAMALGLVLKGVTPLVGLLTILTLCLIERRMDWLRGLHIYWGLGLFIIISVAWLMMVNAAEHSNYLMQMINKDLLPKLQGGHESHGKPPLFHLAILPFTFWPASLFLWQMGVYAVRFRHQQVVRFLLAWILPTWIFFEIMPTKLPQYVLPTFPALALLCALAVIQTGKMAKPGRFLHLLQILWGILTVGLAAALAVLPYLLMQEVSVISILLGCAISMSSLVCVYFAWFGAYKRASIAVLIAALITFPLLFSGLLPQLKPLWISRNITELIQTTQPNGTTVSNKNPLLVVGFAEPSLVFYLNTKQVLFVDNNQAAILLKTNPHHLLLIDQSSYANMNSLNTKLYILAQCRGFNYNKGQWVQLFLVAQHVSDSKLEESIT